MTVSTFAHVSPGRRSSGSSPNLALAVAARVLERAGVDDVGPRGRSRWAVHKLQATADRLDNDELGDLLAAVETAPDPLRYVERLAVAAT